MRGRSILTFVVFVAGTSGSACERPTHARYLELSSEARVRLEALEKRPAAEAALAALQQSEVQTYQASPGEWEINLSAVDALAREAFHRMCRDAAHDGVPSSARAAVRDFFRRDDVLTECRAIGDVQARAEAIAKELRSSR